MDKYGPDYDEFGFFADIAAEIGMSNVPTPRVERLSIDVREGRTISALKWGDGPPEIVFLHGGGQNAHTWDYVALALGRPAIAFDLPGHGQSYWRDDGDYSPVPNAEIIAEILPDVAPGAKLVVGMSLGGATAIRLAGTFPQLVRSLVIVDVTPQVNDQTRRMTRAQKGTVSLVSDPPTYASFAEMAEKAIALSPFRGAEGVRRGVRNNSRQLPDGRWTWRYDLGGGAASRMPLDFTFLWDDVSRITCPATLVLGGESQFVTDDDAAEMKRRIPALQVETVAGAGHAVQSDKPMELVRIIEERLTSTIPPAPR